MNFLRLNPSPIRTRARNLPRLRTKFSEPRIPQKPPQLRTAFPEISGWRSANSKSAGEPFISWEPTDCRPRLFARLRVRCNRIKEDTLGKYASRAQRSLIQSI